MPESIAFYCAGFAMLVQLISSVMLRRMLDDAELEAELFGTPNRILGTPDVARLLRVRYFFPWVKMPRGASTLDLPTRVLLAVARLSGFAFFVGVSAFFLAMLVLVAKGS
jgi:hypothetical protein